MPVRLPLRHGQVVHKTAQEETGYNETTAQDNQQGSLSTSWHSEQTHKCSVS